MQTPFPAAHGFVLVPQLLYPRPPSQPVGCDETPTPSRRWTDVVCHLIAEYDEFWNFYLGLRDLCQTHGCSYAFVPFSPHCHGQKLNFGS
jgi:hypothetical protein